MNTNNNSPLVSIVLSVYNGEKFLRACLDSILEQTYENWELILVNDGSCDESHSIIMDFIKKTSKINYINFTDNKGLVNCLNYGISKSHGKYIARMDADDEMMRSRIETQVLFMEENPLVGILGTAVEFIDEAGNKISTQYYPSLDDEIKRILPRRNPISHPTVMIRKSILELFTYRDKYPRAEDYDLWLRLSKKTVLRNLEIPLLKYRYHSSQISQQKLRRMAKDLILLRIDAIRNKQIGIYNLIHLVKPAVYFLSPNYLINKRLAFRKKRDSNIGQYIMK